MYRAIGAVAALAAAAQNRSLASAQRRRRRPACAAAAVLPATGSPEWMLVMPSRLAVALRVNPRPNAARCGGGRRGFGGRCGGSPIARPRVSVET
jgi:hypothetical protein